MRIMTKRDHTSTGARSPCRSTAQRVRDLAGRSRGQAGLASFIACWHACFMVPARGSARAGWAQGREAAVTRVFLIRHGESESNPGLPSADPGSIPLTADGHRQAGQVAGNRRCPSPDRDVALPQGTPDRAADDQPVPRGRVPAVARPRVRLLGDLRARHHLARAGALRAGVLGPGRSPQRQPWGRVLRRAAQPGTDFVGRLSAHRSGRPWCSPTGCSCEPSRGRC